jgi:hypothetical protein
MIDLLDNYAENCKNSEHQTVFEIAQCNEDFEAVYLMYDYILERRKLKIKKNLARARDFLSTQPNFSLEMKWDVKIKIPLVSYFCPNDVCKIWKYDRNVRLNYSFAEFKNLNCIRIPSSWYFIGGFTDKNTNLLERKFSKRMIYLLNNDNNNNNKEKTKENNKILQKDQNLQSKNLENHLNDIKQSENKLLFITEESNDCQIIQANWMKNIYFNPHEEFEEDEKNLIREDIMANRRIHGEFKLKNCVITESLSGWSKKPVIEKVNGLNAKKYEVSISAFVDLHNKEKFYYEDFIKEDYFNEFKSLHKVIVYSENKENTKKNIADNFKVKNDKMRAALMKMSDKKEKKLKAYVWIAENFPIKSSVRIFYFHFISFILI